MNWQLPLQNCAELVEVIYGSKRKEIVMGLIRRQQQPLARHSPIDELARLRNRIDRLFESPFGLASDLFEGWTPALDLNETDNNIVVKAELPGMKPEEIEFSLRENTLTISGERKHEEESGEGENYRSERYFGKFQ